MTSIRDETFLYRIEDYSGALMGSSIHRQRKEKRRLICDNEVQMGSVKKRAIAEFNGKVLRSCQFSWCLDRGGRRWKEETWVYRVGKKWAVTRRKLGVSWQDDLKQTGSLLIFATGLVFPYFVLGHIIEQGSCSEILYLNPERKWLGRASWKKRRKVSSGDRWGFEEEPRANPLLAQVTFQTLCGFASDVNRVGFIEWDREGPFRFCFPHVRIRMCRQNDTKVFNRSIKIFQPPKASMVGNSHLQGSVEYHHTFASTDGTRLKGSYRKPKRGKCFPCAILVHGSGPENRNSGFGYEGRDFERATSQPFLELAGQLAQKGIATFRYDKRGVGESKGDWRRVSRQNLLDDLMGAIEFVCNHLSPEGCILIGFSEGANLGISAAIALPRVRGLILAGGPSRSIDEIIVRKLRFRHLRQGFSRKWSVWELRRWQDIFAHFRAIEQLRGSKEVFVRFESHPFVWWIEHMNVVPGQEAQKLSTPVLLLHGDEDADVLIEECHRMEGILRKTGIWTEKRIFCGLNHLLRPACRLNPGFEYDVPYPLPKKVVDEMADWMEQVWKVSGGKK